MTPGGTVDLWILSPDDWRGAEDACVDLLSDDERARHERLLLAHVRREHLFTRVLARVALSQYARVAPAEWRFVRDRYGRPHIATEGVPAGLTFNLSNTRDLIVCLVAADRRVGVDVEDVSLDRDTQLLAPRCCAPNEIDDLEATPAAERRKRFFCYWTLKEAYAKALGVGMQLDFDRIAFRIDGAPLPRLDAHAPGDPSSWQFVLLTPTQRHLVALAVEGGARDPVGVRVRIARPNLLP